MKTNEGSKMEFSDYFLRVNNDSINFVCTTSYDFEFLIYIYIFFSINREVEEHTAFLV
jgi:hypothetical protein